jgi:hypothetical protein
LCFAMINLSNDMATYINAVTNPFDCAVPARIPDSDAQMSMSLKDYSANNGLSVTITGTTTDCYGVAIGMIIGANRLAEAGLLTARSHTIYAILLDASGAKIGISQIATANYASLPTYTNFYRFVAAGLRIKCIIEDVTVSTTIAVSRHYAGQVKTQDVYTVYNAGSSFFNLGQQLDCLKQYNNFEGCSMRLDPLQQIYDWKKYRSLGNYNSYENLNGNTYMYPFAVTQFNNPVTRTGATDSVYSIPLIIESIFWLEALLLKPTPLFMTPSPYDCAFDKIVEYVGTSCESVFPLVSKFNSFSNFMNSMGRLGKAAANVVMKSSQIPVVRDVSNAISRNYLGFNVLPNGKSGKKLTRALPNPQFKQPRKRKPKNGNGNKSAKQSRRNQPIKSFNAAY